MKKVIENVTDQERKQLLKHEIENIQKDLDGGR